MLMVLEELCEDWTSTQNYVNLNDSAEIILLWYRSGALNDWISTYGWAVYTILEQIGSIITVFEN